MNPEQTMSQAAQHLSAHDKVLAAVISQVGLCTIRPHTDYYRELVESIIGQQLSLKAAASITRRFIAIYEDAFPTPQHIIATPDETLRAAGLSTAKVKYIKSLASHIIDGDVSFGNIDSLSDEAIIAELTRVKGIGEWTVHMFLIFCMGRPDVLPHGDLGIKSGIKKLYGLDHLPTPQEVQDIATDKHWAPYKSIASWYIWKALDETWDTIKQPAGNV